MAATFNWCEDNGTLTSSHGTVRSGFSSDTHYPTDVNWKNTDDNTVWNGTGSGTAYSASPINASTNSNSYTKYQYGKISGTYNQVTNGLYAHTAGTFGTGLTLKGTVTSTYATPATSTNAALTTDMTSTTAITSGLTVLFSTTGPEGTTGASLTSNATGYTQYLATQLQTTSSAAAGDTTVVTMTLRYDEN